MQKCSKLKPNRFLLKTVFWLITSNWATFIRNTG